MREARERGVLTGVEWRARLSDGQEQADESRPARLSTATLRLRDSQIRHGFLTPPADHPIAIQRRDHVGGQYERSLGGSRRVIENIRDEAMSVLAGTGAIGVTGPR